MPTPPFISTNKPIPLQSNLVRPSAIGTQAPPRLNNADPLSLFKLPSLATGGVTTTPLNFTNQSTTPALNFASQPTAPATSAYQGDSIVDYLGSVGQASDYASRQKLAEENGIFGYVGSAQQNTQLLNKLRSAGQTTTTVQPPTGDQSNLVQMPSGAMVDPATGEVVIPPPQAQPSAGPEAPPAPSEAQLAVDEAVKGVQGNLGLSEEEIAEQERLNTLQESFDKGFRGEGERAIPLPFITGRQRSLEERALGLAQPIQARAALAQAKRTAALSASKFALERADKRLEREQDAAKPKEGFTLGEGQIRFDASGNVVASNVGSEGLSGGFGGQGYIRGENPLTDQWIDLINNGEKTIADVPNTGDNKGLASAVANALAAGGATTNTGKTEAIQGKLDLIDRLSDHPGMNNVVGAWKFARPWNMKFWSGEVEDFVGDIHRLTSKETLQFLIDLKSQGGTLGALNQSELEILKESATTINGWEMKDKDKNPTGKWDIDEDNFKRELNRLRDIAQKALERAGGGGADPNIITTPDGLKWRPLPDGGYEQVDFSQGGGGTPRASEGMRTDRHANPTALQWTSGVESFFKSKGHNVKKGDVWPDGKNFTLDMRNVADPIGATIDYIDSYSFYYRGKPRWNHTAMSKSQWNGLSDSQKAGVIRQMYQKEGGNTLASLFQNYG